ncbi:hypothetical protein M5K25_008170 [Dendrobium thyrsiflorum]|uniref:Protein kinase domain-containing protein n=1 Tax=Dendrobium thyrsiflorum TaxID=117978 RepID=A0ABD0V7Y7_DENTH
MQALARARELLGFGQFTTISISTDEAFAVKTIFKFSDDFDHRLIGSGIKLTCVAEFRNSRSVQLHQVYEHDEAIYLILDLCPSPDLFSRIEAHGSFYESEAAALLTELVESIAECHRRGIAHRDMKPKNVFSDSNGRLLLSDFGSVAFFEKGARTLKRKVGTPAYMAPELIAGQN